MDFCAFHNAPKIDNNPVLDEDIEELHFEDPKNIMDTLFTSTDFANKTEEILSLNLQ